MKKAIRALKIVLKDTVFSREREYLDEAIAELEALENRSCEDCKYFEERNDKCNRGVMTNWKHEIDDITFSCNRWESK